jgi:hypothetical protein
MSPTAFDGINDNSKDCVRALANCMTAADNFEDTLFAHVTDGGRMPSVTCSGSCRRQFSTCMDGIVQCERENNIFMIFAGGQLYYCLLL